MKQIVLIVLYIALGLQCIAQMSVDYVVPAGAGNTCAGEIHAAVEGNAGPFTAALLDKDGVTIVSGVAVQNDMVSFDNLCAGAYQIVITSPHCTHTLDVEVPEECVILFSDDVRELPFANGKLRLNTSPTCTGQAGSLVTELPMNVLEETGKLPVTFTWSDGYTATSSLVKTSIPSTFDRIGIQYGSYSVTVTDANFCTDVLQLEIEDNSIPTMGTPVATATCATKRNGSFTMPIVGLDPESYDYELSDPWVMFLAQPPSYGGWSIRGNNMAVGRYYVSVTKPSTRCQKVYHVDIPEREGDALEITSALIERDCKAQFIDAGSITLDVTEGTGSVSVQWSNGQSGLTCQGLSGGRYYVTVSDDCSEVVESYDVDFYDYDQLEIDLAVVPGTGTDGGFVHASANGGLEGTYSYEWDDGSTSATRLNVPTGVIKVTVTDGLGCTSSTISRIDNLECDGDRYNLWNLGSYHTTGDCGNKELTVYVNTNSIVQNHPNEIDVTIRGIDQNNRNYNSTLTLEKNSSNSNADYDLGVFSGLPRGRFSADITDACGTESQEFTLCYDCNYSVSADQDAEFDEFINFYFNGSGYADFTRPHIEIVNPCEPGGSRDFRIKKKKNGDMPQGQALRITWPDGQQLLIAKYDIDNDGNCEFTRTGLERFELPENDNPATYKIIIEKGDAGGNNCNAEIDWYCRMEVDVEIMSGNNDYLGGAYAYDLDRPISQVLKDHYDIDLKNSNVYQTTAKFCRSLNQNPSTAPWYLPSRNDDDFLPDYPGYIEGKVSNFIFTPDDLSQGCESGGIVGVYDRSVDFGNFKTVYIPPNSNLKPTVRIPDFPIVGAKECAPSYVNPTTGNTRNDAMVCVFSSELVLGYRSDRDVVAYNCELQDKPDCDGDGTNDYEDLDDCTCDPTQDCDPPPNGWDCIPYCPEGVPCVHGYCVTDTDDCDDCDTNNGYICVNGVCLLVDEEAECDDVNACPSGEFCKSGNCNTCPTTQFQIIQGSNMNDGIFYLQARRIGASTGLGTAQLFIDGAFYDQGEYNPGYPFQTWFNIDLTSYPCIRKNITVVFNDPLCNSSSFSGVAEWRSSCRTSGGSEVVDGQIEMIYFFDNEEFENKSQESPNYLIAYPNPTSGQDMNLLNIPEGNYTMKCMTSTGQEVLSVSNYQTSNDRIVTLPTANLMTGLYHIVVITETGQSLSTTFVVK